MQTITLTALAAPTALAQHIEAPATDEPITLKYGDLSTVIHPGRSHTEIRFYTADGDWASSSVTIKRAGRRFGDVDGAGIGWSSSSGNEGIEKAATTARMLQFAVEVVKALEVESQPRLDAELAELDRMRQEATRAREATDRRIDQIRAALRPHEGDLVRLLTDQKVVQGELLFDPAAEGYVLVDGKKVYVAHIRGARAKPASAKFAPYRPIDLPGVL